MGPFRRGELHEVEIANSSNFISAIQLYCPHISVVLLSYDSRSTPIWLDGWKKLDGIIADYDYKSHRYCTILVGIYPSIHQSTAQTGFHSIDVTGLWKDPILRRVLHPQKSGISCWERSEKISTLHLGIGRLAARRKSVCALAVLHILLAS